MMWKCVCVWGGGGGGWIIKAIIHVMIRIDYL